MNSSPESGKPFVLNKENEMDGEVDDGVVVGVFTYDEYQITMNAVWNAAIAFERADKLNEAKQCKDLWNAMYKVRYDEGVTE